MPKEIITSILLVLLLMSCTVHDGAEAYVPIYEEGEELSSGSLGLNLTGSNAFGFSIPGLDVSGISKFQQGNSLFNQSWVAATNDATRTDDGLGPLFNAVSCSSCHFKDGRGRPLQNNMESRGFLLRVSQPGEDEHGGPLGLAGYGGQIQDLSNANIPFEAKVTVSYQTINGMYADGTAYQLRKPTYNLEEAQFGSLNEALSSPRIAQQTIGMGLISALPDTEILKYVDQADADGDGISGRANYVYNPASQQTELGKYGWKANAPTLQIQVAGAFHGDMGLTSSVFPQNDCPSPQHDCLTAPSGGEPEVSDDQLSKILFYQATLVVPNRRNVREANVLEGRTLFTELNCIGCHATGQRTANSTFSPLLEQVVINPYSDFLLHDMGEGLADNRPDFLANGQEWRTQPLWGIGLIADVNNHTNFLHDGRARNIAEAILWHGGEAENSKVAFTKLNATARQQLIDFVNSL